MSRENHPDPATERQINYARDLGIDFPDGLSCAKMSRLIDRHLNPLATEEQKTYADLVGLWYSDQTTQPELQSLIDRFDTARAWVYSVCRHLAKAKWIEYSEVGAAAPVLNEIAIDVITDEKLFDSVCEQEEGWDDRFADRLEDLGIDPNKADRWYFFIRDGASSRSRIYKLTREMIERRVTIER
jgi:hypothetical protein